ncbi:MAG: MFS transporter [Leptospiraceae bacterium]|nr:MFS transporter [Leptospiraceae bacterium]
MNIERPKYSEAILLFTLSAIQFTHILDFVIIMPLASSFMEAFKIGTTEFSIIVSSYTFSAGFFSLICASLVDRYDRKTVLLLSYLGFIIGTAFCAIAPNYYTLVCARILAGAFGGIIGSSVLSIVGDLIPFERRGRATGVIMSSFSIATIVGIPIGIKLNSKFGLNSPFLAISGFSLIILIIAFFSLPSVRLHLEKLDFINPYQKYKNVLEDKNHLIAFALIAMMMVAGFSVIPFIAVYLELNLGWSKDDVSYVYFSGGFATLITARIIGYLADKYGKYVVFKWLAICSILPLTALTNLPQSPTWVVLTVTTCFMIIISGRFTPAMALITAAVRVENRGTFMSINSSIQQFASTLAAGIGGSIITKTANGTIENYWMVGILASCASLACILIARKIEIRGI